MSKEAMNVIPKGDMILVEKVAADNKSAGGIHLTVTNELHVKAKVLGIGDSEKINVKVGDEVILPLKPSAVLVTATIFLTNVANVVAVLA